MDALLEPLLMAASHEWAEALLSQLIAAHAEPVIKGIIRYKLHLNARSASEQAEADDIYQETIVHLLGKFRRFRQQPVAHPINGLGGLAAVMAKPPQFSQ